MTLVGPLVGLGTLALVLWVIAMALAIAVVMGYIAGVLHGLPFPLNQLAGPVASLAKGIAHTAGRLENGVDRLIGASWHALARYLDQHWKQLVSASLIGVLASEVLWKLIHGQRTLRHHVDSTIAGHHSLGWEIWQLKKKYKGIEAGVKELKKEYKGIDATGIRKQLGHIQTELDTVNDQTIPAIRDRATGDEGTMSELKRFLGVRPGIGYLAWAAGIVAAVVGIEAVNLFRCPTWLNKTSKRGCGLWNGLEDLFGLLIDAIALTHLCELPGWINEFFSPFLGELTTLISSAANALCAQPKQGWLYPSVTVPDSTLPPAQHVGQLP